MHHVALTRPLIYALARSGDLVSIDDAHRQFGLIDHLLPQQGTTDLTKVPRPALIVACVRVRASVPA
jgi:hypothetical protein